MKSLFSSRLPRSLLSRLIPRPSRPLSSSSSVSASITPPLVTPHHLPTSLPPSPRTSPSSRLRVAALLGFGLASAALASSALGEDPRRPLKLLLAVPLRLGRDIVTAALIAADYKYSLWGLTEGSLERARVKHETHMRCAKRLQQLCFTNGGIYIKLGQHISQLEYLVPQEYVETMRSSMLDNCPVSSFQQVCDLFQEELGRLPHEVFKDFNPVPLASASLAQVHAAHTHDGRKVAVKVQHMHLTDTAVVDTTTVKLIVNVIYWLFPNFDYRWLVEEVQESLPKELDFIHEAKNGERCMQNFKRVSPHLAPFVTSPKVYWQLSTSRLLTMEFMEGVKVTDVNAIKSLGLRSKDVSKLISHAFAEMIFRHGFVHCDPHAANMMVRVAPFQEHTFFGRRKQPQLVLLDHGLYKVLDPSIQEHYAALWKALVFADVDRIKEHSVSLGAGEDLYILFAGVLTMRPWHRISQPAIDHLYLPGTDEDKAELQMYASQYVLEVSELLRRLPRVILLLLKTNDCLRAIDSALGSPVNTFVIIGRESSRAVSELKLAGSSTIWSRFKIATEMLQVEVRLFALQLLAWFGTLQQILHLLKTELALGSNIWWSRKPSVP